MKRELQRVEIPGEYDARRRTWEVVRAAYTERQPVSWPRRHLRSLALAAAVVAIVAAAVTPPGRSVVNTIRDAVGRERVAGVRNAQRELVRLPAPGRLLVQSPRAAWVVQDDGSRRRLGPYRDAAWSPRGLFVAGVLDERDLVVLEPNGKVRWEKPNKRRVALPRWSFEGFRIAYLAGSTLRVIAGDGTNDRAIGPASSKVAPAWRPGTHQVAYVGPGGLVRVVDADARKLLWQTPPEANGIRALTWSDDGARLLVLGDQSVSVYRGSGRVVGRTPTLSRSRGGRVCPRFASFRLDFRLAAPARRRRHAALPEPAHVHRRSGARRRRLVARRQVAPGELAGGRPARLRPGRRQAETRRGVQRVAPVPLPHVPGRRRLDG